MDFLMNDLSVEGQFGSTNDFQGAVDVLMGIRQAIRAAGRELHCHRGLKHAQVTPDMNMSQAVQGFPPAKKLAWIQWLTKEGPHWEDLRRHTDEDWLEETDDNIVTDHAVGEAGFRKLHGTYCEIVSMAPSRWTKNPLVVRWRKVDESVEDVHLINHWTLDGVKPVLADLLEPIESWRGLEERVRQECGMLVIAADAFAPLDGFPFVSSVADRLFLLLEKLNEMKSVFDELGHGHARYAALYESYFKGKEPYFTDESTSNKNKYKDELTFSHPELAGEELFCPWHGKVRTPSNFPPIRFHFTWPPVKKESLYLVYVGPKITMD